MVNIITNPKTNKKNTSKKYNKTSIMTTIYMNHNMCLT